MSSERGSQLYEAIYGCLLGGAIGDAMGGATEMMSYRHIEEVFGTVEALLTRGPDPRTARFEPGAPAGQVTDDTRLRNLLCSAIIRARPHHGGRVGRDVARRDGGVVLHPGGQRVPQGVHAGNAAARGGPGLYGEQ